MKRGAPILILLVFLIMGITIFWIFRSEGGTKPVSINPFAAATATPEPTATPSPTAAPTATPVPTATPSPTPMPTMPPTPSPTPSPSPTAVPTPTPVITRESSGSFRSDTGGWLNIIVKYNVERNGNEAKLKLDAYVESYSLETAKRMDDVVFTVGGVTVKESSGPINISDNSQKTETLLGSAEFDVTPGSDVRADVWWYFLGTYGGESLDIVKATEVIPIP